MCRPDKCASSAITWKEATMKIKTKVRAGIISRCGGTRCGGGTYYV